MRWHVLILCALLAGGASAVWLWQRPPTPSPRPAATAEDLTALRLQVTDLQRAVETLARTPDPDPAALSELVARLEALTRQLDRIEGSEAP